MQAAGGRHRTAVGQDNQGELLPPYPLFLTLQMQPSQAHAPPSWFFVDKVTTRVRYYELEDGPRDLGYGFAAELEERLSMQPPVVFLHEGADLRGRTLYSVLDRLVDNAHPISLDSYLRTCAYDLTKALNQVLRKNCWEFVTDIYHLFDPDFNPKSLFSLTGVPLCIRQH